MSLILLSVEDEAVIPPPEPPPDETGCISPTLNIELAIAITLNVDECQ